MQAPGAGPLVLERNASDHRSAPYERFILTPLGATIGGLVEGIDLTAVDDETFVELQRARLEWKVLFFRDQHLTIEQHAAFAERWGETTDDTLLGVRASDPVANVVVFTRDATTAGYENLWHADGTFRPMPTAGTILRAIEVPSVGGDTLFADMAAAFDNVPEPLRARLRSLRASHDWSKGAYAEKYADRLDELRVLHPPAEHPVVVRHPATGRETLFVNRLFTTSILGIDPDEGDEILEMLFGLSTVPEFQVRWHWEPGSIAFWDNFACQHYAANDYFPQHRVMARATIMSREFDRLDGVAALDASEGG